MKDTRIVYSEQRKSFKIQIKAFFFFWIDVQEKEYDSIEEAKEAMTRMRASDWKEVE